MRINFGAMAYRNHTFGEGLDAARRAGYSGVGVSLAQVIASMERGVPVTAMKQMVDERGLVVDELELIRLGSGNPMDRLWNEFVLEVVEVFEPRRIHVCAFGGSPDEITDAFTQLCQEVEGPVIGFEFMPYGTVPTLEAAVDLVNRSDSDRARLVLDVFHFFRSGATLDQLDPDVLALVDVVQLCDLVPRRGIDKATESRHLRALPGDGTLPLSGLLDKVAESGVTPAFTLEPHSDALDAMPVTWVAERGMQAMAKLLVQSGIMVDDVARADS